MSIPERYRRPLAAVVAALIALLGAVFIDLGGDDQTAPPTTESTTTTEATTTTSEPTTTTTVDAPPPLPGLPVDPAVLPAPRQGVSEIVIEPTSETPSGPYDWDPNGAQFRTNCWVSHMDWADPIVYPGGRSHLHTFFGAVGVQADWDTDDFLAAPSTCYGGGANRSGYWVPTLLDADLVPVPGGLDGAPEHALQVYYKSGYQGVAAQDIQAPPEGLRMVAGDATRTTPGAERTVWHCRNGSAPSSSAIPDCAPGDVLHLAVIFPQCWDGVNLDSPDHKSHMSYGAGWPDLGCPDTHPVPLPEITQNFYWDVPAGGIDGWRLSSDLYEGPGGYSAHADWWNGWDPDVFDQIIDGCFATAQDCHMNLLGSTGTRLAHIPGD